MSTATATGGRATRPTPPACAARTTRRAARPTARAAGNDGCGANSPCGTLTVQNQTANGVYGPTSPYADAGGGPGTLGGTANDVGMPLAVSGTALQCFYQGGVGNSNPSGFANYDAQGDPQAYEPGTVANGSDGEPASSGTAVTQPIAADDSIASASNNQIATASGFLTGILDEVVNFGAFALNTYTPSVGGLAMIVMGESSLPIPSPGAVVSAGLNIAEAVIANSCDGNLNLMGFAAAEPGGGLAAASISASKEGFAPATTPVAGATSGTAGSAIAGTQLNPSQSMFNGSTLYLQPDMGGGGVQGNVANSSDNQNFIDLIWTNFDPRQYAANVNQVEQLQGNCHVGPVASPTVTSDTGDVNCGTNNAQCPFPAAGFPAGAATLPTTPIGVTAPSQAPATTLGVNECATVMAAGDALPSGQSISSPSGLFTLTMQADGTLALSQNSASGRDTQSVELVRHPGGRGVRRDADRRQPGRRRRADHRDVHLEHDHDRNAVPRGAERRQPRKTSSLYPNPPATVGGGVPEGTSNSYVVMQTDGNLVVYYPGPSLYDPGSDGPSVAFATNTSGNPGAYLAVQNDGNLVLYGASNTALWATNTVSGAPCPPP